MSDTVVDLPPRRGLLPFWAVFAGVNLVLMVLFPGAETVPFHFVWLSLALVYGLAPWSLRTMVIALALVTLSTAAVLWHHASAGYIRIEETTEVPLMASIFLVMVWHVRRRQVASAEVARLAALDRARAEGEQMFVRLMSHEMRTPITVARGYTELLRSAHADEQQTLDDTAVVLDELNKLDRSTHRLVNLVIADPGDLEAVRLDELLDRVAHRWSPTAERRWRVECPDVLVRTDGERLETALDCLLENALTYTADGDLVGLVGRMEADAVVIEVTDSGGGIPATDLPHVFDPFRRGANSGSHPGTGLGLAIVRRTVEAWGGSVAAVSAEGTGTTFTLRLPLSPPPMVVPPTPWIADDTAIAPGRAPGAGSAAGSAA